MSLANNEPSYFIVTMTNFPHLLHRTQQYQEANQRRQFQDHHHYYCVCEDHNGEGLVPRFETMPIPSASIRVGSMATDEYERLLYSAVRFELKEIVQGYFQRTRQNFPIRVVFDLSDIRL